MLASLVVIGGIGFVFERVVFGSLERATVLRWGMMRMARDKVSEATPNDPVLWSVDERGVARVTLNRPEVYNAYNGELIAGLLKTYDALAAKAPRAVVIAGKGRISGRRRHQLARRGAPLLAARKTCGPRA